MAPPAARRRTAYLDVAPLFEREWTGIPVVTAQLAKFARTDNERPWQFLYNNQLIGERIVDELLLARSGRWIEPYLVFLMRKSPLPGVEAMQAGVAIFPNVKPMRSLFFHEAMIVHDLSTLVVPQFHHQATIAHHANRIRHDIESSGTVICVSQATADDVAAYFPSPSRQVLVTPLGVEWPLAVRMEAAALLHGVDLGRFVVVLGTVEPRKNIGLVLDFIARNVEVLETYCFVFVGRDGWLEEREKLERTLAGLAIPGDRVVFTGYVPDALKMALICAASFTIFPSFFEGFGLPVLESVSLGCPVLCSNSSSLSEVADQSCVLFDPTDPESFAAGFAEISRRTGRSRRRALVDPVHAAVPPDLGWRRFFQPIRDWLRSLDHDAR